MRIEKIKSNEVRSEGCELFCRRQVLLMYSYFYGVPQMDPARDIPRPFRYHNKQFTSFQSTSLTAFISVYHGFPPTTNQANALAMETSPPRSPSEGPASDDSNRNDKSRVDPVLRNTLRYTISAKEYELLHGYLLSRASAIRKRAPRPVRYEAIVESKNDFNVATVRLALRLFATTYIGFKGWEVASQKLQAWRQGAKA